MNLYLTFIVLFMILPISAYATTIPNDSIPVYDLNGRLIIDVPIDSIPLIGGTLMIGPPEPYTIVDPPPRTPTDTEIIDILKPITKDELTPEPEPETEMNPMDEVVKILFPHLQKDKDPNEKSNDKDPLVFGQWYYMENTDLRCESKHKFDYDNDGFLENFCYEIVGSIFVIDWNNNGNIDNGAEMLNFDKTSYSEYTPIDFIKEYPDICNHYKCYLWQDTNPKNWTVDGYELIPFSFEIKWVTNMPEGWKLVENGRYAYCYGVTTNGEKFYCVQPTYWRNITN